ncbi:helix-turn-helix domain-containing protein [Bacillus pumilus]|uniref:helix-turn-helix domain-containing protein n=1 Tax=Bacillus TaxID=1386 RepID=UPI0022830F4D|nr:MULTISPECIES: helix-turn-helix domain-containing protein [Bacillus]MCY7468159.1 helix-turn-helix domain-containing protein [Bacillus safensis]MDF2002687.1 helix-turn-helix domain-containing protein [Bacillus pumilus]MDF2025677.1 helix-turn-helix domain-containing protein [Bacillus pumilus]MDF2027569.1 helix-turn-helix domain-containing protein [Bacillus pumilus]MDF2090563.1 helix-turn-helix domain-containing protein [Bacillus pumilus]
MEYHLKNRQQIEDFIQNEVLTSSEAQEILKVNKQRMSKLHADGRVRPIKKVGKTVLFLKSDIEQLKKDLKEGRKKYRPYDD